MTNSRLLAPPSSLRFNDANELTLEMSSASVVHSMRLALDIISFWYM